jgi:superfamily II DNA or RNA helicase
MDRGLTGEPALALRIALDRMARVMVGAPMTVDSSLGRLQLHPHQVAAVTRLREILSSAGGALLADAVGLGKTYVGLALAREFGSAVVICPAALRPMWLRAMKTADIDAPVVTVEALSRGVEPSGRPALLIVDEAHHVRTPGTRRYEAVARLARTSRVLLMSATPLQNSRRDLTSLLALFAGSSVKHWTDDAIARLIVRRDEETAIQRLPTVRGPCALSPGDDDDCLDAILGLPPAIPAADEGVSHALATISLLHLWASSRAALVTSVRKRLARATALRDAVAGGHLPTAAELSAWRFADDSLQLAFPLFAPDTLAVDRNGLNTQLDEFIAAATRLIDRCRIAPDPDAARAALIRMLRARHGGERIVAFSQYARTISALGRLMWSDPGIAIVTATGARIASGAVKREEVLAQFAASAADVHRVERIGLLLTTDLLSEGVDLRGASVIVNLDLPWNPARLEQRVGRARRLGSPFESIHVYSLVPPAPAERMLQLRRRLTDKLRSARTVVGGRFDAFGDGEPGDSAVGDAEALRACLQSLVDDRFDSRAAACPVGAATALVQGWLAAVEIRGIPRMIGDFGEGVIGHPRVLMSVLQQLGDPAPVNPGRLAAAVDQVAHWLDVRDATAGSGEQPSSKREVLERLSQTVARAPRHRRASILAAAQRARPALAASHGVGAERAMTTLARSTDDDEAWIQSVENFSALNGDGVARPPAGGRLLGLVLLERISAAGFATPG